MLLIGSQELNHPLLIPFLDSIQVRSGENVKTEILDTHLFFCFFFVFFLFVFLFFLLGEVAQRATSLGPKPSLFVFFVFPFAFFS